MLSARLAAPLPDPLVRPCLDLSVVTDETPVTLRVCPGTLQLAGFAASARAADAGLGWVRLAPFDLDDSALAVLAGAALTNNGRPPSDTKIVVVECRCPDAAGLLLPHLAAATPNMRRRVIVIHHLGNAGRGAEVAQEVEPGVPTEPLEARLRRRLWSLAGDRTTLIDSLLQAGAVLGRGELAEAVEHADSAADLTTVVAQRLLDGTGMPVRAALRLVALLGYHHDQLTSLEPVRSVLDRLPCWTTLDWGWRELEPSWRAGICAACGDLRLRMPDLGRLIIELLDRGAGEEALELCLDAGYPGVASDLLGELGPALLGAGRTRSVARWLRRLPADDRVRHRDLTGGLAAAVDDAHEIRGGHHVRDRRRGPAAAARNAQCPRSPRCRWWPFRWAGRRPDGPAVITGTPPASEPTPAAVRLIAPSAMGPMAAPMTLQLPSLDQPDPASRSPAPTTPSSEFGLAIRLFGTVTVEIDGVEVTRWHGHKGRILLAYLALNRDHPVGWEIAAEALWPDVSPAASRNRLNVTLHTLRDDLRVVSSKPVVVHATGYALNPDLDVSLDVESFDALLAGGAAADDAGDAERAQTAYERAERLYRGDLVADYPCESWTVVPREHYRVRRLDTLGRICQIAFDLGCYQRTIEVGQRLLELDFCREDLHRLLMRTYHRTGQPHLAMRQYQLCCHQLRSELDMEPAPQTAELAELIRARVDV